MATSNRIRALNRLPFDFEDGLKVGGVDVTNLNQAFTPAGAGLIGFTPVGNISAATVQAALAELDNEKAVKADLAATTGSALMGYDGGTVQDVMDSAKPMAGYTALRAYTGRATQVRITSNGLSGFFYYDSTDTTSPDNGGTIILSSNGKRWKRLFEGAVHVRWFGADNTGTSDCTAAIQQAIKAAFTPISGYGLITQSNGSGPQGISGNIYFGPGIFKVTQNNALVFSESWKKSLRISGAGRGSTIIYIAHDGSANTWYLADSRVAQSIYSTFFEHMTITCSDKTKFVLRHMAGDGGSDKQMWFFDCNLGYGGGQSVTIDAGGITKLIETSGPYNSDLTRCIDCVIRVSDCVLDLNNSQSVDHRFIGCYITTENDIFRSIKGGAISFSGGGITIGNGSIFNFPEGAQHSGGNGSFAITNAQIELVDAYLVTGGKPIVGQSYDYSKVVFDGCNFSTGTSLKVKKIKVTAWGSGYSADFPVTITGGGGSGAAATANVVQGVASISITNGGSGYTYSPIVQITGGGGSGATAEVTQVTGGVITGIAVTNPGSGYTSAPTITLVGPGSAGTGAVLTPNISGVVSSVTVTSNGSGYTSSPAISFDQGTGTGAVGINRFTVDLVDIYSPIKVYIKNCGDFVPNNEYRFTVNSSGVSDLGGNGLVDIQNTNIIPYVAMQTPYFERLSNFFILKDTDSGNVGNGVFRYSGASQNGNMAFAVLNKVPSEFTISNNQASVFSETKRCKTVVIKADNEIWPGTSGTVTTNFKVAIPANTFIKGLYVHRPATGTGTYNAYLATEFGEILATAGPLNKATGWDVYVPINKTIRSEVKLVLHGDVRAGAAADNVGFAAIEFY